MFKPLKAFWRSVIALILLAVMLPAYGISAQNEDAANPPPALIQLETGEFADVEQVLFERLDAGIAPASLVGRQISFALTWVGESFTDADGNLFPVPESAAGDILMQLVEDLDAGTALSMDFILVSISVDEETGDIASSGYITMATLREVDDADGLMMPVLRYVSEDGDRVDIQGVPVPGDLNPHMKAISVDSYRFWFDELGAEDAQGEMVFMQLISRPDDPAETSVILVVGAGEALDLPFSSVTVPSALNIRSGPGTTYAIVTTAQAGEVFEAVAPWQVNTLGEGDDAFPDTTFDYNGGRVVAQSGDITWTAIWLNDTDEDAAQIAWVATDGQGYGQAQIAPVTTPEFLVVNVAASGTDAGTAEGGSVSLDQWMNQPLGETGIMPTATPFEPFEPLQFLETGGVSFDVRMLTGVREDSILYPGGEITSWTIVGWTDANGNFQRAIFPFMVYTEHDQLNHASFPNGMISSGGYGVPDNSEQGYALVPTLNNILRVVQNNELMSMTWEEIYEHGSGTVLTLSLGPNDLDVQKLFYDAAFGSLSDHYDESEIAAFQASGDMGVLGNEMPTYQGLPIIIPLVYQVQSFP